MSARLGQTLPPAKRRIYRNYDMKRIENMLYERWRRRIHKKDAREVRNSLTDVINIYLWFTMSLLGTVLPVHNSEMTEKEGYKLQFQKEYF